MSTTTKKISEVRAQIAGFETQLAAPAHSSLSRAELTEALAAKIDGWHDHALERIASDLQQIAAGHDVDLLAPDYGLPQDANEQAIEARAWLTFAIGKDAMLSRFAPLIEAMPEGLDAAERERQRAEIQRKRVEAEVREEVLLRQAEKEGTVVDARLGQNPAAAILVGWGT